MMDADDTVYDDGTLPGPGYYHRRDNADPGRFWPGAANIRRHRAAPPRRLYAAVAAVAALMVAAVAVWVLPIRSAAAADYTTPMRAMFFYDESFDHPDDHYHPAIASTGFDSDNPTHVAMELAGIKALGMDAAIASWWGQGQHGEATRFPILRDAANWLNLGLIPYYEPEGQGNPSVAQIQSDLAYLAGLTTVRIGGKPVIFVYNAGSTGCDEVTRWKTATAGFSTWYVNMKVFSGFRDCADQPSSWHQYGPAASDPNPGESVHLPWSFNISPGFWHHTEASPRLARDPARWAQNVAHMKASGAQWQLVTSWNEWGEATSVEPSLSWQTSSGWGFYADELHRQLVGGAPAPSPTATATSSPTGLPSPTATTTTRPPAPSPSTTTSTTTAPPPTTTSTTTSPPAPSPTGTSPAGTVTVMAAGDIVEAPPCSGYTSGCQDGWTAELITRHQPDAVLTLGDNQYESNTLAQYQAGWNRGITPSGWLPCYLPSHCDTWGRHLPDMYPAPGNHEWLTANAQGYRDYFGARLAAVGSDTPSPSQLYYSWDLGAWHFVSLDSDCSKVGGCSPTSPMGAWLQQDLAANNGRPTILYFHHPRWSSGNHGNITSSDPLWQAAVADRDVQLVLNGHDHWYERFDQLGANGAPTVGGVREFVVGTGGKGFTCGSTVLPGSVTRQCSTMGVLELTLAPTGYSWVFRGVQEVGGPGSYTDSGSAVLRP